MFLSPRLVMRSVRHLCFLNKAKINIHASILKDWYNIFYIVYNIKIPNNRP